MKNDLEFFFKKKIQNLKKVLWRPYLTTHQLRFIFQENNQGGKYEVSPYIKEDMVFTPITEAFDIEDFFKKYGGKKLYYSYNNYVIIPRDMIELYLEVQ